jgi:hypothetical protein
MRSLRTFRRVLALTAVALGASLWFGCGDRAEDPLTGPELSVQARSDVAAAIRAQERHTPALLRIPGVVGTAVGLRPNGQPAVQILLERAHVGIPAHLDGVPVVARVTGRFVAFSDPTGRQRPAPVGFSVGHPDITAGTIGARVKDAAGNVYVLSNNHVLAASNDAQLNDPAWQPGAHDGGTSADSIGYLWSFKVIRFSRGNNTMDAAIARSDVTNVDNATPADDGYGTPSELIYGDGNGDGVFDDKTALLGLDVQKYGRTTGLTQGTITGVNATVTVCYEGYIICTKRAKFVDQLIIEPGTFSDGGDSGSLIVSIVGNHPVGLLFAGSSTQTIANRIDLVLNYFSVTVDGGASPPPPPPAPLTDVAVTSVSAPPEVTQGAVVDVTATVQNVGNQDVTASFDVTLRDETDAVAIGTHSVAGLAVGATQTLTFSWNTGASSFGSHTLVASHDLADDDVSNNSASTGVMVTDPSAVTFIHVGDLDGWTQNDGSRWSAIVEVVVHDATHSPINGATVRGVWSPNGLASDECTTGELGGNGTCIFLFPGIRKNVKSVTFTVTDVTGTSSTYGAGLNHDVNGSSDGTTITVIR